EKPSGPKTTNKDARIADIPTLRSSSLAVFGPRGCSPSREGGYAANHPVGREQPMSHCKQPSKPLQDRNKNAKIRPPASNTSSSRNKSIPDPSEVAQVSNNEAVLAKAMTENRARATLQPVGEKEKPKKKNKKHEPNEDEKATLVSK
ncbi:hypothetical protein Alg130_12138, partial [Pyrenophora tritici-repentis]